ncbi:MAG: methyltransferase FkbM [Mucilaginibacter sp.]|nr:methyltransferase FkbM [Mucilaginibacter sp.]
MSIKLQVGKIIGSSIDKLIELNYKLTPFIPTGRILPLDLKRANIYPRNIFDVGANIGQTANYFIRHFPDADIYCFEPVDATYKKLVSNINNTNIHTFNEGLGATIQTNTINKNDASGSSSLKNDDGRFSGTEKVKINTAQNFCIQKQITAIDLLKMDVEGYELEVLSGLGPMLKNVKMIYSEVGFNNGDPYKTYYPDLLEMCRDYGFIASGFYEPYRWGNTKLSFFCNVLLINTTLVEV